MREKQKKMNKEINLKGKKGITLIALVITIIVLLILAGVTIATLTGDNRITTKSTKCQRKINRIGNIRANKTCLCWISNRKLWIGSKYKKKIRRNLWRG